MFRSYPHGWPGIGLLLLRLVIGVAVVLHGWHATGGSGASNVARAVGVLTMLAAAALIVGRHASIAALVLAGGTIGVTFHWIPWCGTQPIDAGVTTIFFVSICIAIALLGPGAISLDAHRRGRREIVIPAKSSPTDR